MYIIYLGKRHPILTHILVLGDPFARLQGLGDRLGRLEGAWHGVRQDPVVHLDV